MIYVFFSEFVVFPIFQPFFVSHVRVSRYFHLLFYMRLDADQVSEC